MTQQLSPDEVAAVIHARKILKARGFPADADIKAICQAAGISRKTGYKRANKLMESSGSQEKTLCQETLRLKVEHEELEKRFDDVRFENEGRKLAWEIHGVDKFLAGKKNAMIKQKKKKR